MAKEEENNLKKNINQKKDSASKNSSTSKKQSKKQSKKKKNEKKLKGNNQQSNNKDDNKKKENKEKISEEQNIDNSGSVYDKNTYNTNLVANQETHHELEVTKLENSGSEIIADTTAPTLNNVTVTAPTSGIYRAGQEVTVTAEFSDNIATKLYKDADEGEMVSGNLPALSAKFGNVDAVGTINKAFDGTFTATYTFTIGSGDNGDLTALLNGSVYDEAGNSLEIKIKN